MRANTSQPAPRPVAPEPRTSAAWASAFATHGKALIPPDTSAEAFDASAERYHRGGPAEHNFTMASLALARMAQAEEHHAALVHELALLRATLRKVETTVSSSGTNNTRGFMTLAQRLDAVLAIGDGLAEAMEGLGGNGGDDGGDRDDGGAPAPSRGRPTEPDGAEPPNADNIGMDGDEEIEFVDVGGQR